MAATDQLRNAASSVLPNNLPNSGSSSEEELDLRFLETSEAVVLSFVLDPNSPYYLARLISTEVVSSLKALLAQADEIITVLDSSAETVEPPTIDRNFELLRDSLSRIGDSVAVGVRPELEDVTSFVDETTAFAKSQLVPQEVVVSTESYRSRLNAAVSAIETLLPSLRQRLDSLDPSTFFVDSLPEQIPRAKQLSVFVSRLRSVLDRHEIWLTSDDVNVRVENSPQMLAEAATLISTVSLLNSLSFLKFRFRVSGEAQFVSEVAGEVYGSATAASITGTPVPSNIDGADPFVAIGSGETLDIDVDLDASGAAKNQISVTLPSATAPSATVVSGGPFTFKPVVDQIFLQATVKKDLEEVTYSGSFVLVPTYANRVAATAASPQTGDYAHLLDNSALSDGSGTPETLRWDGAAWNTHGSINIDDPYGPGTAGYSVTLTPEELDDYLIDATYLRNKLSGTDGTTADYGDAFSIVGSNGAGTVTFTLSTGAGSWREVGEDISTLIVFQGSAQVEQGTSPKISDVVDAVNTQAPSEVLAESLSGRRIRISSKTAGASSDTSIASYLRVTAQPQVGTVPLLGLPETATYGTVTVLYDEEADFLTNGVGPGVKIVDGLNTWTVNQVIDDTKIELSAPRRASVQENAYLAYAAGALNYESQVQANSADYAAAKEDLLESTDRLKDLLSQSLFSEGDRLRARNYVLSAIGSLSGNSGPAYTLLGILSGYESPESQSLKSALNMLRERGFDKMVDFLLLGNVSESLFESNASYAKTLREVVDRSGMNNLV